MDSWVYDCETLKNLTVFYFLHYKDDSRNKLFVIHELRNDFPELMDFLENVAENGEYMIGFNVLSFDSQIVESLLKNRAKLEELAPAKIAHKIYQKAQSLISEQDFGDKFTGLPEWYMSTRQIDIFKIWHFDNPAKKSSLKWLQFTCDWHTVQEMPIHHTTEIYTMEQIQMVSDYCKNDVEFTKFLYEKTKPMIGIRQDIVKKYKLRCLNYSNTKMGSELLLKMYCKKTGKKKPDVKDLGTKRDKVNVSEIIFPYIKFETEAFNSILSKYRNTVITSTKGEVKMSVKFKGYKFDYGAGGIHQVNPGVYREDSLFMIKDIDVASLYPSIACANGMYPAHLGPEFYEVYKSEIVDVRLREKAKGKDGNKAIVTGFKEAANASFGNSNQQHSWLLDSAYAMQTTINGQLLLSMIVEALLIKVPEIDLIQTNTDGATFRFPRHNEPQFMQICKEWQDLTKLILEFKDVKSMFIPDVNNYLCVYTDGSIKAKGRFEYENLEPHKNKSFLVVSKGIKEYLVNGILPEDYLQSNRNIFDYCAGSRVTGDWQFYSTCVVDQQLVETPMHKVVRYYISKQGCKIIKVNPDGRRISTVAGKWLQTEFNTYVEMPWEDYQIDHQFYLDAIYKEIGALTTIKTNQLELGF